MITAPMLKKIPGLLLAATLALPVAGAAKAKDEDARAREAAALRRELSALEALRADKLEALERSEAARWEARYKAAAEQKSAEERLRGLEDAYARLAGESSRLEEDLVKARNETQDAQDEREAAQALRAAFTASVQRKVDEAADALSSDVPLAIESRTQAYSRASALLEKGEAETEAALAAYFGARLARFDLTATQSLETRQAVFEDGNPGQAWRLRLGTIFIGEREKEGVGRTQMLLRTGSLQGKTFIWRQELAEGKNEDLSKAVMAAVQGEPSAGVPMDVLQNKSTGSGFLRGDEQSAWAAFKVWFEAGGITLYPLFACGFLALFLILERNFFFARRSTNIDRYAAKVDALVSQGKIREAADFTARSGKSLAKVLHAVLANAGKPRAEAEKAVREVMLREIPALEKRLPILAALGTAAPLLGLLGTVSGLVTLFKVLNQLGSNDPKVLAGGISEALVNTETGLAIAIPVLLVHGWLNERLDTLNAGLQSKGLELMNRLWPKE